MVAAMRPARFALPVKNAQRCGQGAEKATESAGAAAPLIKFQREAAIRTAKLSPIV